MKNDGVPGDPQGSPGEEQGPVLFGRLLGSLWILLGVLAAYGNGLHGAFVFDDAIAIVQNETIGTLWPPSVPLTGPHESPSSGRPLVSLSLALNHAIGGLEPFGYHAFNVAIHLLVSLLLWRIARRLLLRTGATRAQAPALALISALLFAVHPLGSSVVTYVSQRAESMMALFLLVAVYSWIRQREAAHGVRWGWTAVACCFLSALCKEVGYAAPLVAMLVDRAFYSTGWRDLWRERREFYLAMLASWIVLAAGLILGARGATVTWSYRDYDSWTYLLTSAQAILHYVALVFWPKPLVIDYGWPIVRSLSEVWWQVALLGAMLLGSLACLQRRPKLAFLGLSFFLILGPSSSVLPIVTEIMAEHRMYLPSALVISAIVVGLYRVFARVPAPAGRLLSGFALLASLGGLIATARAQNRLYDDPLSMYVHNTLHAPDNYRAHYNLGYHLSRADRYPEAAMSLNRTLRIDPTYAPAHRELSYLACYTGDTQAALRHIDNALHFKPDDPLNLTAKGSFLALMGRAEEGLPYLQKALELHPGFAEAMKWRVNVLLLAQKGRAAERALTEYDPSLSPEERQRDLQSRYRDLMQMVQANEKP